MALLFVVVRVPCGQTASILLVFGDLGSMPFPSHLTNKLVVSSVSNLQALLCLYFSVLVLSNNESQLQYRSITT